MTSRKTGNQGILLIAVACGAMLGIGGCQEGKKTGSDSGAAPVQQASGVTQQSPSPGTGSGDAMQQTGSPGQGTGTTQATATTVLDLSTAAYTAADLAAPTSLTSDNASELVTAINGISAFYNSVPASVNGAGTGAGTASGAGSGTSAATCLQQVYGRHNVQSTAEGSLKIDLVENDLSQCMQSDPSQAIAGAAYSSYGFRLLATAQCPGVDLSAYNGKSYAYFLSANPNLFACTSSLTNVHLMFSVALPTGVQGQTSTFTFDSKVADATATGASCLTTQISAELSQTSGCTHTELTTKTNQGQVPSVDFRQVAAVNVLGTPTGTFYTGGTSTFNINGWTGTMHYTGVQIPSTWTAVTSGTGAKMTASGTLGATALVSNSNATLPLASPGFAEPTPTLGTTSPAAAPVNSLTNLASKSREAESATPGEAASSAQATALARAAAASVHQLFAGPQ